MKNLLLTFAIASLALFQASAQSYSLVMVLVTDTNGMSIANQPVTVTIGNPVLGGSTISGTTNSNGVYMDSVANISTVTPVTSSTTDCNSITVSNTKSYSPNNFNFIDTLVICTGVVSPPPGNCQASYYVDSLMSGGASLFIWNTSTPLPSAATQVNYLWDFGDGITSNQPYPTHTYSNPGSYAICLTINSVDSLQRSCTSIYCDTIGIDSLGNVLYKSTAAGFTLNVLDPATMSIDDNKFEELTLYPNPATDVVNIDFGTAPGELSWMIIDLKGSIVSSDELVLNESQLEVGLKNLNKGFYILSVKSGSASKNIKLLVE